MFNFWKKTVTLKLSCAHNIPGYLIFFHETTKNTAVEGLPPAFFRFVDEMETKTSISNSRLRKLNFLTDYSSKDYLRDNHLCVDDKHALMQDRNAAAKFAWTVGPNDYRSTCVVYKESGMNV